VSGSFDFRAKRQKLELDGFTDALSCVSNGAYNETLVDSRDPARHLVFLQPRIRPTRLHAPGRRHVHGFDQPHLTAWNRFDFLGRWYRNPTRRDGNPVTRCQSAHNLLNRHSRIAGQRHDMHDVGDFAIGTHWIDLYVRRWWNGDGIRNNCDRRNSGHCDNVGHYLDIGQHYSNDRNVGTIGNVDRSRVAANLWDVDNLRNWNGRRVRVVRI
jgi:hypothetical protein